MFLSWNITCSIGTEHGRVRLLTEWFRFFLKTANLGVTALTEGITAFQFATTEQKFDQMQLDKPAEYLAYVDDLKGKYQADYNMNDREAVIFTLLTNPSHTMVRRAA